jgi:pimeloyl-ACP methyl ester carboxylesterase
MTAAQDPRRNAPSVRREIEVEQIRWSFWDGGRGFPLVFLHGAGSLGQNWTGPFPFLAQSHRVLVPDLPGHGESGRIPPGFDWPALVRSTQEFLRRTTSPPVDLVGHSLGGTLALSLSSRYPSLVRRLVVLAPAIRSSAKGMESEIFPARPATWTGRLFRRRDVALSTLPRLPATEALRRWNQARQIARQWLASGALLVEVEKIRAPCLVLWGEEDAIAPVSEAPALASRLRNGRYRILPGEGHMLHLERPALFTSLVEDFLDTARPVPRGPPSPPEDGSEG